MIPRWYDARVDGNRQVRGNFLIAAPDAFVRSAILAGAKEKPAISKRSRLQGAFGGHTVAQALLPVANRAEHGQPECQLRFCVPCLRKKFGGGRSKP